MTEAPALPAIVRQLLARCWSGKWPSWIAVGVYLSLASALFWPAAPWSSTSLPAGFYGRGFGDPQQMTWFLEWVPYALRHGLDLFQSNYLDYPRVTDLANTTSVPLLGLLAAPVTLGLGPVAAFNILIRLAFASSATSMFFVLRTWCRRPAAFVGGLLYGFGPYMIIQGQNHLNLVFLPFPPVIVWCVYELVITKRRNPVRVGLLLGGLAAAQALVDPELLAMLGIVLLVGVVGLMVVAPRRIRENFSPLARAAGPAILVFVVLSGYLVWSLLFGPNHIVGPVYPARALQAYRADLLEPFFPTVSQFFAPLSLSVMAFRFVSGNVTENAGYLDLPFVLLLLYFSVQWRKNRLLVFSAWLALVAFILSLGSRLSVDAHVTSIPLPEALLTHVSLFQNLVPARFAFAVILFGAIAFALGLDQFLAEASRHRTAQLGVRILDITVVVLLLATLALMFPVAPLPTQTLPWPASTVSTLDSVPTGSVVLTYPFPISPWTESMIWQAEDEMHFRLIGGYITTQSTPVNGESYPNLLSPKVVEETILKAQFGTSSISGEQRTYPAPNPHADVQRALCVFLHRYRVGAVVFWRGGGYRGVRPQIAHRLFSAALGAPTVESPDHKLLVWLIGSIRCEP